MSEYVVSCNLQNFNLIKHFEEYKEVVCKQTKKCAVGDTVYIYVGRPFSRLYYICDVIDVDLQSVPQGYYLDGKIDHNAKRRYMRLRLSELLPESGLELINLQSHGLKTVQCATCVSDELHQYINRVRTRR